MIYRISKSIRFRCKNRARIIRISVKNAVHKFKNRNQQDKHTRFALDLASLIGPLDGKRILEIGTDNEAELLIKLVAAGAVDVTGANPALSNNEQRGNIRLLKCDARKLPLSNESMDAVVSISVLEHVKALDEVLDESFRILRPGGYFYAEFGPIWSSIWGHHLWFYHGGEIVDWRTHRLPPYAHLLMSENALQEWCAGRFGNRELAAKISNFVFHSEDQNRLFFNDYDEIVSRSNFQKLFLTGCPDIPESNPFAVSAFADYLVELRQKFPDKSGFGYHVGRMFLMKPR